MEFKWRKLGYVCTGVHLDFCFSLCPEIVRDLSDLFKCPLPKQQNRRWQHFRAKENQDDNREFRDSKCILFLWHQDYLKKIPQQNNAQLELPRNLLTIWKFWQRCENNRWPLIPKEIFLQALTSCNVEVQVCWKSPGNKNHLFLYILVWLKPGLIQGHFRKDISLTENNPQRNKGKSCEWHGKRKQDYTDYEFYRHGEK